MSFPGALLAVAATALWSMTRATRESGVHAFSAGSSSLFRDTAPSGVISLFLSTKAYLSNLFHRQDKAFARCDSVQFLGSCEPARLLFVGSNEPEQSWGKAIEDVPGFKVSFATDYRELWLLPGREIPDIVVLLPALSLSELDDVSRFIRQRWAEVRILVVREGENFLDDALYDDRMLPGENVNALLARFFQLARQIDFWRFQDGDR